jgi:hypothetical protein
MRPLLLCCVLLLAALCPASPEPEAPPPRAVAYRESLLNAPLTEWPPSRWWIDQESEVPGAVEELAAEEEDRFLSAELLVLGTVRGVRSFDRSRGDIWTEITLEVEECLLGPCGADTVLFAMRGGTVDTLSLDVGGDTLPAPGLRGLFAADAFTRGDMVVMYGGDNDRRLMEDPGSGLVRGKYVDFDRFMELVRRLGEERAEGAATSDSTSAPGTGVTN